MAGYRNEPEWDPDPYEGTWAEWETDDAQGTGPAGRKKDVMSVTHDLTDDELRRFFEFDTFYDPMPLFGLVPQWVWLAMIFVPLGCIIGSAIHASYPVILLGGLAFPIAFLRIIEHYVAGRRRHARAIGLCDGRTVMISPAGLSVRIPTARPTSILAIGPLTCSWGAIRKISVNDEDLTFWMRPAGPDLEGRARVVVPLRVFADAAEALAFEGAARRWHAAAAGGRDVALWENEDL